MSRSRSRSNSRSSSRDRYNHSSQRDHSHSHSYSRTHYQTESHRNISPYHDYNNTYSRYNNSSYDRFRTVSDKERADRILQRQTKDCIPSIWGSSPPPSPKRIPTVTVPDISAEKSVPKIELSPITENPSLDENHSKTHSKFPLVSKDSKDSIEKSRSKSNSPSPSYSHHQSHHSTTERSPRSHSRHHRHHRRHHRHHESSSSSHSKSVSRDPYKGLSDDDLELSAIKQIDTKNNNDSEEEGPQPEVMKEILQNKKIKYDGDINRAEGDAMAAYVQKQMRIPRRGEVGYTGDQIEKLEEQGFVMSGSRHRFMNAVRLRKENQVYSAEEKRALALHNYEESEKKEKELMAAFKQQVNDKLRKKRIMEEMMKNEKKNELLKQNKEKKE
ncbi:hypothetical protein WA158_004148 [Blastocystis sp. Blastoise]